jgi:hypothetical protein
MEIQNTSAVPPDPSCRPLPSCVDSSPTVDRGTKRDRAVLSPVSSPEPSLPASPDDWGHHSPDDLDRALAEEAASPVRATATGQTRARQERIYSSSSSLPPLVYRQTSHHARSTRPPRPLQGWGIGVAASSLGTSASAFRGLSNLGRTCYINSVACLFTHPHLYELLSDQTPSPGTVPNDKGLVVLRELRTAANHLRDGLLTPLDSSPLFNALDDAFPGLYRRDQDSFQTQPFHDFLSTIARISPPSRLAPIQEAVTVAYPHCRCGDVIRVERKFLLDINVSMHPDAHTVANVLRQYQESSAAQQEVTDHQCSPLSPANGTEDEAALEARGVPLPGQAAALRSSRLFSTPPTVLALNLGYGGNRLIEVSSSVTLKVAGTDHEYVLAAASFHGRGHFVSIVYTATGSILYNDSVVTLNATPAALESLGMSIKQPSLVCYVQRPVPTAHLATSPAAALYTTASRRRDTAYHASPNCFFLRRHMPATDEIVTVQLSALPANSSLCRMCCKDVLPQQQDARAQRALQFDKDIDYYVKNRASSARLHSNSRCPALGGAIPLSIVWSDKRMFCTICCKPSATSVSTNPPAMGPSPSTATHSTGADAHTNSPTTVPPPAWSQTPCRHPRPWTWTALLKRPCRAFSLRTEPSLD